MKIRAGISEVENKKITIERFFFKKKKTFAQGKA
jgi:hypothetical protein